MPTTPVTLRDEVHIDDDATATTPRTFGPPVAHADVTLIPVARVRSRGRATEMQPVGYIEVRDGHVTFHPLRRPAALLLPVAAVCLSVGIATAMVLSVLRHTAPRGHQGEHRGLRPALFARPQEA